MKITTKDTKAWVTFEFDPTQEIESVEVVGEWNDWNPELMKKKKSGEFYFTKILKAGQSYQFGYRTNNDLWFCDPSLPTINSPLGTQNSFLEL